MKFNERDRPRAAGAERSAEVPDDERSTGQRKRVQSSPAHHLMNSLKKVHVPAIDNLRAASIYLAIGEVTLMGDYAEFGVYRGGSARFIHTLMFGNRKLHLFDSFEGQPEDPAETRKGGGFKLAPHEMPKFNPRRTVVQKGWFKDTVPAWVRTVTASLAFAHMDADLYGSTTDALFNADRAISKGTVILFGKYVSGARDDGHRALTDWSERYSRKFEYLWRTTGPQVCIRVTV